MPHLTADRVTSTPADDRPVASIGPEEPCMTAHFGVRFVASSDLFSSVEVDVAWMSDESMRRKPSSIALSNSPNRMGSRTQGTVATGAGVASEGSAALDARPSAWARSALGNNLVSASLSGEALGGLGGFLASEHAFEAAGMGSEALSSNAAMLRVMRDNIALAPMDDVCRTALFSAFPAVFLQPPQPAIRRPSRRPRVPLPGSLHGRYPFERPAHGPPRLH